MNRLLKTATVVLLAGALLNSSLLTGCSSEAPELGKTAPGFTLQGLDGREVSLSEFHGKPVLLNFWASWCGPCRLEMPFLQEIHEKWSDEGLVLLTVNLQEDRNTVEEFINGSGYTFPVLLAQDNKVPLSYNVRSIPATFFIDADGVIRFIKVGAFFGIGEIESRLAKIMP